MPDRTGHDFDRGTDDLFLAALELDPTERPAFLDKACAGNRELRAAVESLLAVAEADPGLLDPPDIGLIPERLGRYEIVSELGRGGMGIVFKALDGRLLRTVALKVLPQHLSREARSLARFTREAQTLARLNHPNIATLHSLDESDGFHFLTMEFVEGVTLARVLAERSLAPREALSLGLQVALALESAHAQGVCHCDLKPANIMVAPDGRIALLDFGIARAFGQLVAAPAALGGPPAALTLPSGTPGYMAPEQAAGRPVDERSDLWALGVVLYECLTGEPLPGGADGPADGWQEKLPGATSRPLVALLRACLEPDPDRRLASATLARTTLEHLLRRPRPLRRWVAVGAGSVALAAGAVWLLLLRGPEGPVVQLQNKGEQTLVATNAKGETLWSRQFDTYRVTYPIVLRDAKPLGGGSGPRAVTGCAAIVEVAKYKGTLELFSPLDGKTLWTKLPGWTVPVNAHGPFQYDWLSTVSWPGQESQILVAGIRDGPWYGFAVEFTGIGGDVLGIYHHPGPLTPLASSLKSAPGHDGPVFFGLNSSARFDRDLVPFETGQHPGCVLQLDTADAGGQGFPYSQGLPEERDWPGMPPAREKAYLLVPLLNPDTSSKVLQVVTGEPGTGEITYTVFVADGRVVTLDRDLFPLKSTMGAGSTVEKLLQEGRAQILPYLYLRHGQEQWVDVPLGY